MIENQNVECTLLGNGLSVAFPSNIKGYEATQYTVYAGTATVRGEPMVLDSDYTVLNLNEDAGANFIFSTVPAVDVVIRIERNTPATQTTNLTTSRAYNAQVLEDQLDWLTMGLQEVKQRISNSLRVYGEPDQFIPETDHTVVWNGTTFVSGPSVAEIETAQAAAAVIAEVLALLESLAKGVNGSFVLVEGTTLYDLDFNPGLNTLFAFIGGIRNFETDDYTIVEKLDSPSGVGIQFGAAKIEGMDGLMCHYWAPLALPFDPNLSQSKSFLSRTGTGSLKAHIDLYGATAGYTYFGGDEQYRTIPVGHTLYGTDPIADLPGLMIVGAKVYLEHFSDYVGGGVDYDDAAGIAACAYLAAVGGGELVFKAGKTYRRSDAENSEWTIPSDTVIHWEPGAWVDFDDTEAVAAGLNNALFNCNGAENVTFTEANIRSSLLTVNTITNGKSLISGAKNKNISLLHCNFVGCRNMTVSLHETDGAKVHFNTINGSGRDGFRFPGSRGCNISHNKFYNVGADPIALHSKDDLATDDDPLTVVNERTILMPEGHIVTNNQFWDCRNGVRALGAKAFKCNWNTFIRSVNGPIDIQEASVYTGEGHTSMFALEVIGNIIMNPLIMSTPLDGIRAVIKIRMYPRDDLGSTQYVGTQASPFDYNYQENTLTGTSIGAVGVKVTGNQIMRTLPNVAAQSDWGYGLSVDRALSPPLVFTDPAVTEASWAPIGIYIEGPVAGLEVHSNGFTGFPLDCTPLVLKCDTLPNGLMMSGAIRFNNWRDCPGKAIELIGGTASFDLDICDNDFDLDPFIRHTTTHAADNTWTSISGVRALEVTSAGVGMVRFHDNRLKNLAQPCNVNNDVVSQRGNLMFADPTGGDGGNNAGNKGVRVLDRHNILVHCDCDPTSATFGTVLTFPKSSDTAMPTTGTYLAGHFVAKPIPALISGTPSYVIRGWLRLVTGPFHVWGVDWLEITEGGPHVMLSADNAWAAKQTFGAGLRSGSLVIEDDAVATITTLSSGQYLMISSSASNQRFMGHIKTSVISAVDTGSGVTVTTGVLTGTTGVDGDLTLSINSNTIYLENRTGASRTFGYTLLG